MAMACMGDPNKHYADVSSLQFKRYAYWGEESVRTFNKLAKIANGSEQDKFDIAAALQRYTEDFVFTMIDSLLKETKQRNICFSGGVALNSVMIGKLYSVFEKEIDNIYVCPVPYDAGLCIGAAQYVWHQVLGNDRIEHINNSSPYLGIDYTKQQILDSLNLYDNTLTYEKRNQTHVLGLLSESKIVSLFCGKSESGRRALGNRSIIADPRNPEMKDTINQKVKHRQWYRPFAPSIMREHVSEWFVKDIDSPYMSKVINFKPEMGKKVPAVNHFNGSARLQTVTEQDNKLYYNLLKEWNEISGVPILLNTSFNDREPIVETPNDAIKCFLNTDIDHLYFLEYELLVSKK
jgi:carbamoyltransferase